MVCSFLFGLVLSSVFAPALAATQQPASPQPQATSAPSLADAGRWIAGHLPSQYDEVLAGTTNTIVARYSASACTITVTLDYSSQFNSSRNSDRSPAFSVKANPMTGHFFNGSEDGGTIDFSIINPSSLRIADATEYLGTLEVAPGSFEFTFRSEADAKAMLDAMTSFTKECASGAVH